MLVPNTFCSGLFSLQDSQMVGTRSLWSKTNLILPGEFSNFQWIYVMLFFRVWPSRTKVRDLRKKWASPSANGVQGIDKINSRILFVSHFPTNPRKNNTDIWHVWTFLSLRTEVHVVWLNRQKICDLFLGDTRHKCSNTVCMADWTRDLWLCSWSPPFDTI